MLLFFIVKLQQQIQKLRLNLTDMMKINGGLLKVWIQFGMLPLPLRENKIECALIILLVVIVGRSDIWGGSLFVPSTNLM